MAKRIIQVPMDQHLLGELNYLTRKQRRTRSDIIREACLRYVKDTQSAEMDRLYEQGYTRLPEEPASGEAQLTVISESIGRESW